MSNPESDENHTNQGKTAVREPSSDTLASNDSESVDNLSAVKECASCPAVSINNLCVPSKYVLKNNEMMFDREGATSSTMTLSTCIHIIGASNVPRMFFAHSQVIRKDATRCFASFYKYPNENRFADIPCIEDSRVKVKHPVEEHDYIHASWVDGYREPKKFIVGQAPMPHTMEQFWKMHWQEKVTVVVSMIQMYNVKKPEVTLRYIPTKTDEVFVAGQISVRHCGTRRIRDTYDATILKITYQGEVRKMLHICYFGWPDKGTPTRPTELLNMIADMNHNRKLLTEVAKKAGWMKENDNSPISIHCLAGTGRSCVVVAIDIACRKLDDTAKRPIGPMADVEDLVLRLRCQRAMAVQKAEQYLLINLSLYEYALRHRYVPDEVLADVDLSGYFYRRKGESIKDASEDSENKEKLDIE